jgi:hypothetical protein
MACKLSTTWTTVYAATVTGFITIYKNYNKLEANRELTLLSKFSPVGGLASEPGRYGSNSPPTGN